jgi:hypothetical protein
MASRAQTSGQFIFSAMNQEDLNRAIREFGLEEFRDELHALAQPCLQFTTREASAPIASQASKLGGIPDLPPDVAWPKSPSDVPLLFLGRIVERDLQRIHPHLRGHLLFFADWAYEHVGRVISVAPDTPVAPRATPPRPDECIPQLTECIVDLAESLSLPDHRDEFEAWQYSPGLRAAGLREIKVARGNHHQQTTVLEELIDQTHAPYSSTLARPHRVFGHALFTQSHPAEGAEQTITSHWANTGRPKEEFIRAASRWTALLSLETDYTAKLCFNDTGNCGFLVTKDAFAAGDFSRCEFYQDDC